MPTCVCSTWLAATSTTERHAMGVKLPLPTHCCGCQAPVTVLWNMEALSKPPTKQKWVCPKCGVANAQRRDASVVAVWEGHTRTPPR
jgi:hypothetical protein